MELPVNQDQLLNLPLELMHRIATFAGLKSTVALAQCSHLFYNIFYTTGVFRGIVERTRGRFALDIPAWHPWFLPS